MAPLPNIEAYPKTIRLHDDTQVQLRPLEEGDKLRLLRFFERIPEAERYFLKENVTAPEVVKAWTSNIDFERVIPIVAVVGEEIVADATLHRSRAPARRHIGEFRVVVDPQYREIGLGSRLIRELFEISVELGLYKVVFELVPQREKVAVIAAERSGFREVTTLKGWVRDAWGNYQDLAVLEMPLKEEEPWWRF